MNKEELKFGSIIPLIGGFTIAGMNVFNKDPEFILSFPNFKFNDSILLNNYPQLKEKYFVIEDSSDMNFIDEPISFKSVNKNIDLMIGVPICGGLSQLNTCNNKDSDMCRGADAVQNRFMKYTTEFILEKVQPKVYIFENAPNLYTSIGKPVRDDLIEISKKYGYSITFYKTCTNLHGIPQKRTRTYTFCWKSEYAPIVNFYKTKTKNLKEYLEEIPNNASLHDIKSAKERFNDDIFIKFIKYKNKSLKDILKHKTILNWMYQDNLFEESKIFFKENDAEYLFNKIVYIQNKLKNNLGFWDFSPLLYENETNAIISKNLFRSVHPDSNRFLTKREYMHLMGLPHNFEISEKQIFTITQNVPVKTSEDMIKEGFKFINGELEMSTSTINMQNNINETIELEKQKTNSFLDLFGGK